MKKIGIISLFFIGAMTMLLQSCKVTFIRGYDPVIDQTATQLQTDFNAHWLKVSRTIQDDDSNNQKFENFQDYYDKLDASLTSLKKRSSFLPPKSKTTQQQVVIVDSAFRQFINIHKNGIPDRKNDDRQSLADGVNFALDGLIKLQEEIKNSK